MKLPFVSQIPREKLTDYLLVFHNKNDKSRFLAEGGYTLANWQTLEADLRSLLLEAIQTRRAMKFELFSQVALAEDVPEHSLRLGDMVTIVELLPANGQHQAGYIVEVFSVTGQTLDVVGLLESQLEPLRPNAIPSMREFAEVV